MLNIYLNYVSLQEIWRSTSHAHVLWSVWRR